MNKSRTDSSSYSDPDNLLTDKEEDELRLFHVKQLDGFFENFKYLKRERQLEIADDILQGGGWVITLMRERANHDDLQYEHTVSIIAFNIKMNEDSVSNKVAYDIINEAATEYAQGFINDNKVFWEY